MLLLLLTTGFADDTGAQRLDTGDAPAGERFSAPPISPGMPLTHAFELLGSAPDQQVEVGAACGMLEVSSWRDRRLQIISVDGVISAVSVTAPVTRNAARAQDATP